MYELAKKARAGMKSKAERLAGEKDRKTDSSNWSPAEPLNADVKTGMRPVSRRAYKSGGKVEGCAPKGRADRKPRKAGGRVEQKGEQPLVDRYINRDLKKANEYRDGTKHVGALKHGGRAHKADGGKLSSGDAKKLFDQYKASKQSEDEKRHRLEAKGSPTGKILQPRQALSLESSGLKHGGRAAKANGGSMSMEEMIRKNPAPAKKPLGLDKVPLPPRRPANLTTAVPNPKPDETKRMKGDYISPQEIGKKHGGRTGKADGGSIRQRFNAEFAKQRAAGAKKFTFEGKEYTTELYKPTTGPATRGGTSTAPRQPVREKIIDVQFGGANTNSAGKPVYTAFRVMGTGQGASTTARSSITPPSQRDQTTQELNQQLIDQRNKASGGMKKGGRAKKQDGGGMDPRLGIVKPKALEFAQNLVTPGLKKGGRVKKEVGGAAKAAGAAATQALANAPAISAPTPSTNIPPVGSGILPKTPGNYEKPPAYDPDKYNPKPADKFGRLGKGFKDIMDRFKNPAGTSGAKKGGRIAKQIGGALGRSMGMAAPGASMNPMMNRGMPSQFGQGMMGRGPAPQAFANAQGRPFQPGGKFATQPAPMQPQPAPMPNQFVGNTGQLRQQRPPLMTTMPVDPINAPLPRTVGGDGMSINMDDYLAGTRNMTPTPAPMPTLGETGPLPGSQYFGGLSGPMVSGTSQLMPSNQSGLSPSQLASLDQSPGQRAYVGMPPTYATGGRIARASGGSAKSKGKGKTNINIIIATGSKKEPQSMIPPAPQAPMGMPPMPAPNAPAAAPMGMPPMPAPPMGGGQPPMPGAFKQGGRVSKVAKSYKDMTAGAGSGEGRLQKTDIAKRSAHKAGGKVYRSYKDMDAGSGSGKGRLEKTEIQSRKR